MRHLLSRILDAVVWVSKERDPNIMYRSLDMAVSGTLDNAVLTGDVCTLAIWTSGVSMQPFRCETFGPTV